MASKIKSAVLVLSMVLGALAMTSSTAKAQGIEFLGVNKKAVLTSDNTIATVTGSVVCDLGGTFQVESTILQNHAGTNVAGTGETPGPEVCTGTPKSFAVQVQV